MTIGSFRFPIIKVESGEGSPDLTDPEVLALVCPAGGYIPNPSIYIAPVVVPESSTDSIIYIVNGSCGSWSSQRANRSVQGTNPVLFQVFDKDGNVLHDDLYSGGMEFIFSSPTEYYSVKLSATGGDYFTRLSSSASFSTPVTGIEGCIVNAPLLNSLQTAFQYNFNFKWIKFNSTLINLTTMYGAFEYTDLLRFEFFEDEYPNLIDIGYAFMFCRNFTSNPFKASQQFPVLQSMANTFNTTGIKVFTFPLNLPAMLNFTQVCSTCTSLQKVNMFTNAPLTADITSMFRECDIRHDLVFPPMPNIISIYGTVINNNQLPKVKFEGDYDSVVSLQTIFSNGYLLQEVEFPRKIVGTTVTSVWSNNNNLKKIILPDILTSTNAVGIPFNFSAYLIESLGDCDNSASLDANQFDFNLSYAAINLTTVNHPKLRCKRVQIGGSSVAQKNPNLTTFIIDWANSKFLYEIAPQIKINEDFDAIWLDNMFTLLPTVSAGQTCDIGWCTGYFSCTRSIATSKGWTIRGFAFVSADDATLINSTNATLGGTVTEDGGFPVTMRGVCYNTSPNPTISNIKTSNGTGIGTFSKISGTLSRNKTYYMRAYATNSFGTSYGEEKSFTTLP